MSFPPFPPFPAYAMYTTGGRGRGGGRGGGGGGHMAGPRGDQFGGWQWGWGGAGGGAGGGAAWQVQYSFVGRVISTATRPLIPGSQWGRGRPRRSRLGRGIQRLGRQSARRPRRRRLGRGGRPRRRSEATGRLQGQVSPVSSPISHNIYEVYFTFLPVFFLVQSSCDLSRQEREVMVPFTFAVLSLCGAYINLLSAKRPCRTAKLETSEHLKDMNELFRKELNSNFCAR